LVAIQFKRLVINLLILTISIVIFLAIAEIGFRIQAVLSAEVFHTIPIPEDVWNEYHPELGWKHIPGKNVPGKWGAIPVIIDSQGFRRGERGESDISGVVPTKKSIIAIGDSFTFGHRVAAEDAWPSRLEEALGNKEWRVINMGACGYGLDQMFLWLQAEIPRIRPELVVLGLINDDIRRVGLYQWASGYGRPRYKIYFDRLKLTNVPVPEKIEVDKEYRRWKNIFFDHYKSYFLDFILKRLGATRAGRVICGPYGEESILISEKLILAMRDLCRRYGAEFVIVAIPKEHELDKGYNFELERLINHGRLNGIEVIEARDTFASMNDLYIPGDGHPTPAGHKLIARRIYDYLSSFPGGGLESTSLPSHQ